MRNIRLFTKNNYKEDKFFYLITTRNNDGRIPKTQHKEEKRDATWG